MDDATATRRPRRRTLLSKLRLVFLPGVIVVAALFVDATREARGVHEDLARLAEEEREAQLSQQLLVELRGAEAWTKREIKETERGLPASDLDEHLQRAQEILSRLSFGPEGADPSDVGHQGREARLYANMLATISATRNDVASRAPLDRSLDELQTLLREAEVLDAEMRDESQRSTADLDRRTQGLVARLLIVGLALLLTIVASLVYFQRLVLRPLQRLRDAAVRLGEEREYEPLPIASTDEFGQLNSTFNHMAEQLTAQQTELEDRVRDRTRELIRTARLADLGTIAAGIAHEINNPLASIAAGIEGLGRSLRSERTAPPEVVEYLDIVVKEAYRAKDITERLLRFGRSEAGTVQPVWMEAELADVVSMLRSEAHRRHVEFDVDFDEELPPVPWEPGECRQVFFNLLRNALHAAPPGSSVLVRARSEDGGVRVVVRDRGPGLDEEELDRVFEPFFTTKPVGEGTGLGLAIVERILTARRGRVWARNTEQGAEFGFWIAASQ